MPWPFFEMSTAAKLVVRAQDMHRVKKDWGYEEWIVNNDRYCGKRLILQRGWQCSLHHHEIKHETFHIEDGKVRLELGDQVFILLPGDTVEIPVGVKHRFGGLQSSVIYEFSTHHDDKDSYRTEGELSRSNSALLESPE